LKTDVSLAESLFTHDGNETVGTHIRNAVEMARNPYPTYLIFKASETQKIDLAMSSVLAHEAAGDVIAAGYTPEADEYVYY